MPKQQNGVNQQTQDAEGLTPAQQTQDAEGLTPAQRVSIAVKGVVPDDSKKSVRDRLSADLQNTSLFFAVSVVVGVWIVARHGEDHPTLLLLWAFACLASGMGGGFLFGIPKVLQGSGPSGGGVGAGAGADQTVLTATPFYHQRVNTNLEEISDWITKILVGLGLINLSHIPAFFNRVATYLVINAKEPQDQKAFALALIVYFLVVGFLFGYLITRLYLQRAFGYADQAAEGIESERVATDAKDTLDKVSDADIAAKQAVDVVTQAGSEVVPGVKDKVDAVSQATGDAKIAATNNYEDVKVVSRSEKTEDDSIVGSSPALTVAPATATVAATATKRLTAYSTTSADELKPFQAAKQEMSKRFLRPLGGSIFGALPAAVSAAPISNVVGVGLGEKLVDGRGTGVLAVKFLVQRKLAKSQLAANALLPESVDGLPVDVEEVGLFRAFQAADAMPNPRTKIRPAQPGCSVGFQSPNPQAVMAGTFGALVQDAAGSYILSNNHVLADENRLPVGSPIFQPGLLDGGQDPADQIATLDRFINLDVNNPNDVDCALAIVTDPALVSNAVLFIGAPRGMGQAQIDMTVQKFGRTTGYTVGRITSVDTDVTVGYDSGNYTFASQIIAVGLNGDSFSNAGDSGSLILDRGSQQAVGLLFAGSPSHTIANHIDKVLLQLGVALA